MIVNSGEETSLTIGDAAVQCALRSSKLVSFRNCHDIEETVSDLKNFDGIRNANFWFGLFTQGVDNKQRGSRNFLPVDNDWIVDS